MSTILSIILKRASKVYYEGEMVCGVVVVEGPGEVRHEGLTLHMLGAVSLQPAARHTGLLDAFSANVRPMVLAEWCVEVLSGGRVPGGQTEMPFEAPLRPRPGQPLLETYHGVFVNIVYTLKATMKRSFLNKPLVASCQFFVQQRPQPSAPVKPVRCEVTPGTIRAAGGGSAPRRPMPSFHIYAEIDSTVCPLDKPITGKIRVDECSVPIKSIELQLVRVESCGSAEGFSRDATEIQNIQVGDGDVVRGRALPLYMVLPRLFTCPTTTALNFTIEFELNIAVIFEDDYLVTENFPILLVRSK